MNRKFQIFNFELQINFWLVLIFLLFLFTRAYRIDSNPPSLYWDEASIGYNSYSVLKTGKDEWGVSFPLHFRAFTEFKLPVYIYTVSGFEALFGMSELAVRLPAVFYSLGSLLLVYALTKLVSQKEQTALLAALFFAVQPWFFIFSRTGQEATSGLFFYLLGIWLFFKFSAFRFPLSAISFVLSMYSYNSFRIITPITIIILAAILFQSRKEVKQQVKSFLLSLAIVVLGLLPVVRFVLSGGNTRFDQVSIFKNGASLPQVWSSFWQNYLAHFTPQFLVLPHGESARSLVPGFSQLDPLVFLLIFPGLWWLIKNRSKLGFTFLLLMLIAPIPAALTFESPHGLRALSMLPFLVIIAALGVELLSFKKWLQVLVSVLVLGFFGWYFYKFITIYPRVESIDWQYPYKQINTQYEEQISRANNVYISPKLAEPYIYTLFYQKYDPTKFRQQVEYNSPDQWGFSLVKSFGKYHFADVEEGQKIPTNSLIFELGNDTMNQDQVMVKINE